MATARNPSVSWQQELSDFFKALGLVETSRCLDTELLVLSRQRFEKLPQELEKLVEKLLQSLEGHVEAKEASLNPLSTAEQLQGALYTKRKRSTTDDADDEEDQQERVKRFDSDQVQIRATNSDVQQRIQTFIQAKQNDVDASNRTEFLNRPDPTVADVTCARTDAREINRNIQMKFDIVNNEDGPLARSMLMNASRLTAETAATSSLGGVECRVRPIEDHLNVQFQPGEFSLFERIKILENTLMEIERQHPMWAAMYFNQPNRTFPPPPPVTYISRNLPPSLSEPLPSSSTLPTVKDDAPTYTATQIMPADDRVQLKTTGRANSSLTRAVIEQLNKQKQSPSRQTGTELSITK
ncbi:hypothetical protein DFQ28_011439 [Apophysomyces sp. BC1034]|nr:hypothetical protein DFQ30_011057 [Apophysomyces sp. BC1015]KAG0181141.1 hypothetical protein DFQ29_009177 [Apophysomyces sp. BC1021]KAG0191600.1 hypothetical protein DFQ28_011439 [Apophysomyces sp. BC1034]